MTVYLRSQRYITNVDRVYNKPDAFHCYTYEGKVEKVDKDDVSIIKFIDVDI